MLHGISDDWTANNEGEDTWSAYEVISHLIHGEKTDWMPGTEIILSEKSDKAFHAFDRFELFEESKGNTLAQLLNKFSMLRQKILNSYVQKILPIAALYKPVFIQHSER